jgi:hypothetical protein
LEKKYPRPTGFLWRLAGGDVDAASLEKSATQIEEEGKVQTTKSFRDSIVWYLNKELETTVRKQQMMVEIRLEKEKQKQMSALDDKRNSVQSGPVVDRFQVEDQELSQEQLQLFENENNALFSYLNDQMAKVTQAEKSLLEIGSLQQTLVGHLNVQGEMIEQLVEDVTNTEENLRKGNRELKKASERSSTAKSVFWATAGLCSFLVFWDLIF